MNDCTGGVHIGRGHVDYIVKVGREVIVSLVDRLELRRIRSLIFKNEYYLLLDLVWLEKTTSS